MALPISKSPIMSASRSIFIASPTPRHSNHDDLKVCKKIAKGKFLIMLARSKQANMEYALKIFPYEKDKPSQYFNNEIAFRNIKHPNIIEFIDYKLDKKMIQDQRQITTSYIIMEYAPYGDLSLHANKIFKDEKLVRTYFTQLINALEFLHSQNIYHLDVKPENLLIGKSYQLKICDFDLSYIEGDEHITSRGTPYFRAPEIIEGNCFNLAGADIYSAGIILFYMFTGGFLPHHEGEMQNEVDLYSLLNEGKLEEFWETHSLMQSKPAAYFSEDFKELFVKMTLYDPLQRAGINEIKKNSWFNGPIYSLEEISSIMQEISN
jgi:serine/threonine protein kinase